MYIYVFTYISKPINYPVVNSQIPRLCAIASHRSGLSKSNQVIERHLCT